MQIWWWFLRISNQMAIMTMRDYESWLAIGMGWVFFFYPRDGFQIFKILLWLGLRIMNFGLRQVWVNEIWFGWSNLSLVFSHFFVNFDWLWQKNSNIYWKIFLHVTWVSKKFLWVTWHNVFSAHITFTHFNMW